MDFVMQVYGATSSFQRDELFGLTSQLRRAAVSVPSNIAEGRSRRTTREFLNFLSIAYGSLAEIETQLMLAQRLNYLNADLVESLLCASSEIGRLINGLSAALRERLDP